MTTVAAAASTSLIKITDVLNNNSFKPGWGFTVTDAPEHANGPSVLVNIYTPHGTQKWGKSVNIAYVLIDDDAFQAVAFINDHIERLSEQFSEYIANEAAEEVTNEIIRVTFTEPYDTTKFQRANVDATELLYAAPSLELAITVVRRDHPTATIAKIELLKKRTETGWKEISPLLNL